VYALGSDDVDVPHGSDEYWPSDKILIPPYPE
jgi:hypothetical protein